MKKLIREIPLHNGLTLRFFDATRRYFGDYHQVRIEISCEVPVTAELFDDAAACEAAVKVLGRHVQFLKKVEHQGVPTAAISEVTEKVIQDFVDHSLCYFESDTFPKKLVYSELKRLHTKIKPFMPSRANG